MIDTKIFDIISHNNTNEFVQFANNITTDEIKYLFEICIFNKKFNLIDILLQKNTPPPETVFYAINKNMTEYIELLIKYRINLDIISTDGLTPSEYYISIYGQKNQNNKMENLLDSITYTRKSKWWKLINNLTISNNIMTPFEKKIYDDIQTHKIYNIVTLNTSIIVYLIEYNKLREMRIFLKKYQSFTDKEKIYSEISKRVDILNNIDEYLQINAEILFMLFDNYLYKKLVEFKKYVEQYIIDIINHLISHANYHGFVFLQNILKIDTSKFRFENDNTTLHKIVSHENIYDVGIFARIILFYNNTLANIQNNNKETPIFNITNVKMTATFDLLLIYSDITKQNNDGETILHKCIKNNFLIFVKKIVMHKDIDKIINIKNTNGETPLLLACKFGHSKICNMLIQYNADLEQTDNNGNSIYHYINSLGLFDIKIGNTKYDPLSCKQNENNNNITPMHNYINYIHNSITNYSKK